MMKPAYLFLAIGFAAIFIVSYVWLTRGSFEEAPPNYIEKTSVAPIVMPKATLNGAQEYQ